MINSLNPEFKKSVDKHCDSFLNYLKSSIGDVAFNALSAERKDLMEKFFKVSAISIAGEHAAIVQKSEPKQYCLTATKQGCDLMVAFSDQLHKCLEKEKETETFRNALFKGVMEGNTILSSVLMFYHMAGQKIIVFEEQRKYLV